MKTVLPAIEYNSEEELVAGLLNNDQLCFSTIYELYSGRLFGLILKWSKDHKIAELILYRSFVKAWQDRNSFDADAECFYWWLCRLARICYHENLLNRSGIAL